MQRSRRQAPVCWWPIYSGAVAGHHNTDKHVLICWETMNAHMHCQHQCMLSYQSLPRRLFLWECVDPCGWSLGVGGWAEKAWVCCNSDGAHHECSEACSGTIASMCCMHIGSSWCDCPFISFLSYILFFYPPLSSSLFFPPLVSSMFLSHYISSIMSSPLFDKLSSTQVSWQAHICNVHIHVGWTHSS